MTELYYITVGLFLAIAAAIIYFEMNDKSDNNKDQLPVENPEVEKLTKVKKSYTPRVKKNNTK